MTDFAKVEKNLRDRGFEVKICATGAEAADYLNDAIDGLTVGIGGSSTVQDIGLYEKLESHNTVFWHWKQDAVVARKEAMNADIYITSANALAETGEMVNIDGVGNRISATLFGHKKVYYIIGKNKLVSTYKDAVWRARNVAAPARAIQLNRNTPCTVKGDKCYDCKSPERICRGMTTIFGPMMGMEAEVVLIDEEYGL